MKFAKKKFKFCVFFLHLFQYTTLVGALQSLANAECGDLLLSLCYVTKDQTLTVAIMKGINLTQGLLTSVG